MLGELRDRRLLLLLLLLLSGEDVANDTLNAGFAEDMRAGGKSTWFVEVLEANGADPDVYWNVFYLCDLTL